MRLLREIKALNELSKTKREKEKNLLFIGHGLHSLNCETLESYLSAQYDLGRSEVLCLHLNEFQKFSVKNIQNSWVEIVKKVNKSKNRFPVIVAVSPFGKHLRRQGFRVDSLPDDIAKTFMEERVTENKSELEKAIGAFREYEFLPILRTLVDKDAFITDGETLLGHLKTVEEKWNPDDFTVALMGSHDFVEKFLPSTK